jgi:hypothetical protein
MQRQANSGGIAGWDFAQEYIDEMILTGFPDFGNNPIED